MSLPALLRAYRRRKTITAYLTRLGPLLARRYGRAEHYTPAQVTAAAKEGKMPTDDICYALAIYCTPEDFDAYHVQTGEECHYWEMRTEVAEHHFHGNGAFTPYDVGEAAASHSHAHGGFDSGSGHHFGGDGGHH